MGPGPREHSTFAKRVRIVIALLLGTLFLFVLWPASDEPDPSPTAQLAASPPPPARDASTVAAGRQAGSSASLPVLPSVELDRILFCNPFVTAPGRTAIARQDPPDRINSTRNRADSFLSSSLARLWQLGGAFKTGGALDARQATPPSNETQLPTFAIKGIIAGGKRPAALIGDKVVHEQELLNDNWRVLAIRPDRIVVRQEGSISSSRDR